MQNGGEDQLRNRVRERIKVEDLVSLPLQTGAHRPDYCHAVRTRKCRGLGTATSSVRPNRAVGRVERHKHAVFVRRRVDVQPAHWPVGRVGVKNMFCSRRARVQPAHWPVGRVERRVHGFMFIDARVRPAHWQVERIERQEHELHVLGRPSV